MELRQRLSFIRFSEWRFLQLSIFLFILIFLSPLFSDRWLLKAVANFVFLNTILVIFSTKGKDTFLSNTLIIIWISSVVFSFLSLYFTDPTYVKIFDSLEIVTSSILILIMIFSIMIYVFKNREISFDSIFASLTVYMMIALFFAMLYLLLEKNYPGSYKFPDYGYDLSGEYILKSNLFYFSVVTIATLGYGDIVPITPLSRTLSMMEAVIGQFFVAVVIALLIGKLIVGERNE